jgi:tetratricopeptide (TPR) repeat protein
MSYRTLASRFVGVLCAASMFAVFSSGLRAHAASIVLGDIEYTREGRVDDEGRGAIEAYLEFFLSRLQGGRYGRPQRVDAYLRQCTLKNQPKEPDGSCPLPDFYIQLKFAERGGDVQISGAVAKKTEPTNTRTSNLESIRVRLGDLTEGLSRVAKNINKIIVSAAASTERIHVVIACFGSGDAPPVRPRSSSRQAPTATSVVSAYADRLPKVLEYLMRDPPRMSVSINTDARAECGSLEGLQAIAQTVTADAVLGGRVFNDDNSGLMVLPYILINGANRKVVLPPISVPRAVVDTAGLVRIGQKPDGAAKARASLKHSDLDTTSYRLVADRLVAAANALVGASKGGELARAINGGNEVSFYLDRAKEHLSSSPPNYDAAEMLLELTKSKAPREHRSYLLLADSLADRTRYKEAAATLLAGLRDASERKALYVALAETFVRDENLLAARQAYKDGLSEKVLAEEEALLGIARTYLAGGAPDRSPEKAMEHALAAAAQNPSSPEGYFLAGQIAESEGKFEQAEKYYQDAWKISPTSAEIASRLSRLYERRVAKERAEGRPGSVIRYLTKSIDVSPSVSKYFDRAQAFFDTKDYASTSADYQAALQIARRDDMVLGQFPWLLPNLVESLILEGKFQQSKEVARELFLTLGSDSAIRPSTDPKEVRLITAFLNAAAEILDTGRADKELYLLENVALGVDCTRLAWSFDDMLHYLDNDYPGIKSISEQPAGERTARVAAVKQWINRLKEQSR